MHWFSPPWNRFYFYLVLSRETLNSTDMRGRYYYVPQLYLDYLKIYPSMPVALLFGCLSCTFPPSNNRCAFWIVFKIVLQSTWEYSVLILFLLLFIFFKHFNLRDLAKLQLLKTYIAICSFCFPFKLTFAKVNLKGLNIPSPLFQHSLWMLLSVWAACLPFVILLLKPNVAWNMEYICLSPRIENKVISLLSCLSKFCHQVYINKSGSLSWDQEDDDRKKTDQNEVAGNRAFWKNPQFISLFQSPFQRGPNNLSKT